MNCPFCQNREHVEIDLHADGFSQDILECGDCGGVWTFAGKTQRAIRKPSPGPDHEFANFRCPTCKMTLSVETDLEAFQFHEEIFECTSCGTVCSSAHDQLEVVRDSQSDSFLSATSDIVEADDYVFI